MTVKLHPTSHEGRVVAGFRWYHDSRYKFFVFVLLLNLCIIRCIHVYMLLMNFMYTLRSTEL